METQPITNPTYINNTEMIIRKQKNIIKFLTETDLIHYVPGHIDDDTETILKLLCKEGEYRVRAELYLLICGKSLERGSILFPNGLTQTDSTPTGSRSIHGGSLRKTKKNKKR
jgi:hypothetical protein